MRPVLANEQHRHGSRALGFLVALCLLLTMSAAVYAQQSPGPLDEAYQLLISKSLKDKQKAVTLIAESGDPISEPLLRTLMEGDLYYEEAAQRFVAGERRGKEYALRALSDGSELGTVPRKAVSKVRTNNAVRKQIREVLATLTLKSADPDVRLRAVNELIDANNDNLGAVMRPLLETENNAKVSAALQTGIALSELQHGEAQQRLEAIDSLSGSLNQTVRNTLRRIADNESEAPELRTAAADALQSIAGRIEFYGHLETLFFGLSLGSVLVLAAIGLAITFGVMGVINMAHGELIMLGAYTTYLIQQAMPGATGWSLLLAIPAAFMVSGAVGILIERGIIRFLYGRPLETLLATFGVSLILQQLVRTLISPQNVPVSNPSWMSGSWQINSVLSLTYNRLYIFIFCLIVFTALYLILRKTRLGLQVRAVSQNRAMARAMGVRSARVDAMTFGLGAGIAGVAGVALSQLTNVGPNLGQAYIIDSFMVVVFGGVGNLFGTLVAGLSLGVANKVMEPWAGAVLAKILVLVFIILFIQKRPRGLFPQKGRAAGN
ncbi:urea ABC transporter permease subunit UrtB [Granulosicoccaceae sp. 1_MG-2023]|nr:urea ABC transporter permease subunit UrtB [Granulosicoccaceae sp. 1_MG-2023]